MSEPQKPNIAAKVPAVLDLAAGTYFWCSCGLSTKQPFCDGSHKGTGLAPGKFELTEAKRVALCQCKQSAGSPFCDGAHKGL